MDNKLGTVGNRLQLAELFSFEAGASVLAIKQPRIDLVLPRCVSVLGVHLAAELRCAGVQFCPALGFNDHNHFHHIVHRG